MIHSWYSGYIQWCHSLHKLLHANLAETGPRHGCLSPTDLIFMQSQKSCPHAAGGHQQIAGVRMAAGTFLSRITAEYPADLAHALATIIAPYVTKGSIELPLDTWQDALPKTLKWPQLPTRMEDGGGLTSTASHMQRPTHDKLAALRSRWFRRLSDTKHCLKITAALTSGCKEPPLTDSDLQPYIVDMLEVLDGPPGDRLLQIPAGEPFRFYLRFFTQRGDNSLFPESKNACA